MNIKHFVIIIFLVFFSLVAMTTLRDNSNLLSHVHSFLKSTVFALYNPAVQENQPSVFLNSSSGLSLSIQLKPGSPDIGKFALFIPDDGYYQGVIPLQNSGEQIVNPNGEVEVKYYPLNNQTPSQATIRMTGEINTLHMTISLNIWVNGVKYKFLEVAKPSDTKAIELIEDVLTATAEHNWSELYLLLSSDIKSTTSQARFEELMTASTVPNIISTQKNGLGEIKNIAGTTYYIQPVTLTVSQAGGITTNFSTNVYLIFEQGTWKFLTTDTPTQ